jgi:UDP-N-acetyl-D-mannosaminuronic acid dehydrogenase
MLVDMLARELADKGKSLQGSKVAVLGVAMKDFSNDDRISPPHHIAEILVERGAQVQAYDPAVPSEFSYKAGSLDEAVDGADALLLLAVQQEFVDYDWRQLAGQMADGAVLLDAKNRIPRHVEEVGGVKLVRI